MLLSLFWYIMGGVLVTIIFFCACLSVTLKKVKRYEYHLEESQAKKKQKELEREKWKYARLSLDNPLLVDISRIYMIMFSGPQGAGKSLLMNAVGHWLYRLKVEKDKNQHRFNKFMRPKYVQELRVLDEAGILPVYTNNNKITLTKEGKQLVSQDALQVLKRYKKGVEGSVHLLDEWGAEAGKKLYNQKHDEKSEKEQEIIAESMRYIRQDTQSHILMTEQDKDNVFIEYRRFGFAQIIAKKTYTKISVWGQIKKKAITFFRNILPAFLTVDIVNEYKITMLNKDRFLLPFRLLFPSSWLLPTTYYTQQLATANEIDIRHRKYSVLFEYNGREYYVRFCNEDLFVYDTRGHKAQYEAEFDKSGNRKFIDTGGEYA